MRVAQKKRLGPGDFVLASTLERFVMPTNVMAQVADKSTWARRGLAVQNTIIEPGWEGWLTLELTNHGTSIISLQEGTPIAQIIFMRLDQPTEQPYEGQQVEIEQFHEQGKLVIATATYESPYGTRGGGILWWSLPGVQRAIQIGAPKSRKTLAQPLDQWRPL